MDGSQMPAARALKRSASLDGLPLTAYDTGLPAELNEVSIARTFQHLELRKLERRRTGTLRHSSTFWTAFWLLSVLAWWGGLFRVDVDPTGATPGELQLSMQLGVGVLLGASLLFLAVATVIRVAQVIRFVLYEVFTVALLQLYVVLARDPRALRNTAVLSAAFRREGLVWGLPVLVCLELLTVSVWFALNFGVPALLASASEKTVARLYRLRRAAEYDQTEGGGGVAMSYSPPWWLPSGLRGLRVRQKVRRFFYSGQLQAGRPHGFGEWRDDASGGECMRGFWHEGCPVAPFRSRLTKTGYAFEAIHVAFATARAEPIGAMARQPRRHGYGGLRVGLAAIECSVSGEFFSALPRCLLLRETALADLEATAAPAARDRELEAAVGEEADADAPLALGARARAHNARELSSCLALLRHSDEGAPLQTLSVSLAADGHSLQLAGFSPTAEAGARAVTITVEAAAQRAEPAGAQQLRADALAALDASAAAPQAALGARFMPPAAAAGEAWRAPGSARLPPSGACAAAEQLAPRLAVHGWRPTAGRRALGGCAEEVLIYIHGFSCPTAEGLKRVGQLFALGRFPPHIKPLCFSWPTGASFLDYQAAARMAASAELATDLRACLRAVRDSGVRDVHFLTHSMGAAVLAHALPLIQDEFEPLAEAGARGGGGGGGGEEGGEAAERLRMASVTLANPELFEDQFWSGPFPRLCALCAQLTIYGDESDGALFWSELLNRKEAVGRLQRAPYALALAGADAVARGHVLAAPPPPAPAREGGAWADVDCVDCTWLESNVHAIRHNSFGLNRMMVDDIRECIVDRRRAAQRRSRLVRKIGNVFSFLQPPPHVVNH